MRSALKSIAPRRSYMTGWPCLSRPHTCDGHSKTQCPFEKYVKKNTCLACPKGYTCDGAVASKCADDKYVDGNVCLDTLPTSFESVHRFPSATALRLACAACIASMGF